MTKQERLLVVIAIGLAVTQVALVLMLVQKIEGVMS